MKIWIPCVFLAGIILGKNTDASAFSQGSCKQILHDTRDADSVASPVQDSLQAVLNYTDNFGVPVVKVTINNNEYTFVFDTGAGMTCISDKIVRNENLSTIASENYIVGMEGNIAYTQVPALLLGNLYMANIEAIVLPENNPTLRMLGIDGIIGANMLMPLVVTFNARQKTITLSQNSPENMNWEQMQLWDGLPLLNIKLQGNEKLHDIPAVFDSGSSMGAFGLPSVEGFEQWTEGGLIGNVEEGRGTTTLMLGGRVGTDKLYRGNLNECHIGDGVFPGIPVYTGGMGYLLLCYKITELGQLILDYPNQRFCFNAYEQAEVWQGDRRPVQTAVVNAELKIVTVWGKEALEKLQPGYTIVAFDDKPAGKVPSMMPNVDEFIKLIRAREITVRDTANIEHTYPASLFLSPDQK